MTEDILKLALRDLRDGMVVISFRTDGINHAYVPAEVLTAFPDTLLLILDSEELRCAPVFNDADQTLSIELMFARLCGGPRWVTIPFDRIITVQVFTAGKEGYDHVGSWFAREKKIAAKPAPPVPTTPVPARHGMKLVN